MPWVSWPSIWKGQISRTFDKMANMYTSKQVDVSGEYCTNQHLLSNDSCSGHEFESHFELIMPSWSPKTGVNIDILMDTAIFYKVGKGII